MNATRVRRIVALLGMAVVTVLAEAPLATPLETAACEPVVCPAIAKLCPQGQVACRVSPCNCAVSCKPEGQCNN
jgi:hypothetical protein